MPTLTIFDLDETLFRTYAEIEVHKDGKLLKTLTNREYNTYRLQPGETFSFHQFKCTDTFVKTSVPIKNMITKMKRIAHNARAHPLSKTIILTARGDFNDREGFLNHFRALDIAIDKMHVERSGNIPHGTTAEKKCVVVRKYLDTGVFDRTVMYDDAITNLESFKRLEDEYRGIRFESYVVEESGHVRPYDQGVHSAL